MEPVLRDSGQRPTIQRVDDRVADSKGVSAIAVVRVGPDRIEPHAGHDREIAADLDATVARAAGIAIVESRRLDLVGDDRVTHVGLEDSNSEPEPLPPPQ